MNYLDYSENELRNLDAYWTAKEIQQQPDSWIKTKAAIDENRAEINDFLSPILAIKNLRIILTGAGTSAFVGGSIAPSLSFVLGKRTDAVATTDLVSNPYEFFQKEVPTLVVSFARSGNSPESTAAVDLAEKLVDQCFQLVLTCNPSGQLYRRCNAYAHSLALLMPEETNDRSFAMTSSFTSMMLSAVCIFSDNNDFSKNIELISSSVSALIGKYNSAIKMAADRSFSRVVYLGSGGLKALAQEAALKLLELTDGKIVAIYDSPLGFRHGPKTIIDNDTLVVMFLSNDSYTRQYDLGLLRELRSDGEVAQVVAVTAKDDEATGKDYVLIEGMEDASDTLLLFPHIVCAQILAFHYALKLKNKPDSPSASGTVNRVVQGVTIHPLETEQKSL